MTGCPLAIPMELEPGRKNIVILGAGFGGITALIKLRRGMNRKGLSRQYNLILISKSAQHLYTPALYEIAAIPRGEASAVCLKSAVCIQIEDIIGRFPGIRFIGEAAHSLDPHSRRIALESGDFISFEYAIVALGAETNFFNIPGLEEHSYPIKTFEDAVRLRNVTEELMRKKKAALRIVVGGAGATGVELSAEFVNYLSYLRTKLNKRDGDEITLLEASPEILAGFSPEIIARARRRLKTLGVRIITAAAIKKMSVSELKLADGRAIPYDLLVWSGGVRPAAVLKNFNIPLDPKGRVTVNQFLEASPRIYAVGDCVSFTNLETGKPVPGNVPVAEQEARLAAKNIIAEISGGARKPFRPFAAYPFILAVGGKYAVTDLVIIKFFGFLGWLAKQLVELRYLLFILPWRKAFGMWVRAVYYSTANDQ